MILTQTRPRTTFQSAQYEQHQHALPSQHQQNFLEDLGQASVFYSDRANFDLSIDDSDKTHSVSSSPISTQSHISQYSNLQPSTLSTFDTVPTVATPQRNQQGVSLEFAPRSDLPLIPDLSGSIFANSDLMQTDAWASAGHLTPKSFGLLNRHHRESSFSSSLGSAGPASPYSQNTSNPQIAVSDSMGDGFHGIPTTEDYGANYTLVKSFPSPTHDTFYTNYSGYAPAEPGVMPTYPSASGVPKQRGDRGLLPVPNQSVATSRSRPVSVASSIVSDSPATPSEEPRDDGRRKQVLNVIPKLDRTMTDIYNDELFNPNNFTITPTSATHIPISPNNELFAQRLQAANSQHLSVGHSPISVGSRDRSPFRNGSPLAPSLGHEFPIAGSQMRFSSAQQIREQTKAVTDAQALQQHFDRSVPGAQSPRTISPKDAVLEFTEPEGEMNFPLFPHGGHPAFGADPLSKTIAHSSFDTLPLDASAFENYHGPQIGSAMQVQVPQQYPFIAQAQPSSDLHHSRSESVSGPTELTRQESSQRGSTRRPLMTNADGGTYTCTYHGCAMRFETPALLQKHKREGHRQTNGINGARKSDSGAGMTSSLINSQAGPHKCDRINPSTGKPCNTIFSRPYDLTRHEDTIHNARKQKVRCDLCSEEKTFSRADALTRHYRVCHPDVEFPGKHRRRGGNSA